MKEDNSIGLNDNIETNSNAETNNNIDPNNNVEQNNNLIVNNNEEVNNNLESNYYYNSNNSIPSSTSTPLNSENAADSTKKKNKVLPVIIISIIAAFLLVGGGAGIFFLKFYKSPEVKSAEKAIAAIGEVNLKSYSKIVAAEKAYDKVPSKYKNRVKNYNDYVVAKNSYETKRDKKLDEVNMFLDDYDMKSVYETLDSMDSDDEEVAVVSASIVLLSYPNTQLIDFGDVFDGDYSNTPSASINSYGQYSYMYEMNDIETCRQAIFGYIEYLHKNYELYDSEENGLGVTTTFKSKDGGKIDVVLIVGTGGNIIVVCYDKDDEFKVY